MQLHLQDPAVVSLLPIFHHCTVTMQAATVPLSSWILGRRIMAIKLANVSGLTRNVCFCRPQLLFPLLLRLRHQLRPTTHNLGHKLQWVTTNLNSHGTRVYLENRFTCTGDDFIRILIGPKAQAKRESAKVHSFFFVPVYIFWSKNTVKYPIKHEKCDIFTKLVLCQNGQSNDILCRKSRKIWQTGNKKVWTLADSLRNCGSEFFEIYCNGESISKVHPNDTVVTLVLFDVSTKMTMRVSGTEFLDLIRKWENWIKQLKMQCSDGNWCLDFD